MFLSKFHVCQRSLKTNVYVEYRGKEKTQKTACLIIKTTIFHQLSQIVSVQQEDDTHTRKLGNLSSFLNGIWNRAYRDAVTMVFITVHELQQASTDYYYCCNYSRYFGTIHKILNLSNENIDLMIKKRSKKK